MRGRGAKGSVKDRIYQFWLIQLFLKRKKRKKWRNIVKRKQQEKGRRIGQINVIHFETKKERSWKLSKSVNVIGKKEKMVVTLSSQKLKKEIPEDLEHIKDETLENKKDSKVQNNNLKRNIVCIEVVVKKEKKSQKKKKQSPKIIPVTKPKNIEKKLEVNQVNATILEIPSPKIEKKKKKTIGILLMIPKQQIKIKVEPSVLKKSEVKKQNFKSLQKLETSLKPKIGKLKENVMVLPESKEKQKILPDVKKKEMVKKENTRKKASSIHVVFPQVSIVPMKTMFFKKVNPKIISSIIHQKSIPSKPVIPVSKKEEKKKAILENGKLDVVHNIKEKGMTPKVSVNSLKQKNTERVVPLVSRSSFKKLENEVPKVGVPASKAPLEVTPVSLKEGTILIFPAFPSILFHLLKRKENSKSECKKNIELPVKSDDKEKKQITEKPLEKQSEEIKKEEKKEKVNETLVSDKKIEEKKKKENPKLKLYRTKLEMSKEADLLLASEIKRQQGYLKKLNEKVQTLDVKVGTTYRFRGIHHVLANVLKFSLGVLTIPFSKRRIFGTAVGVALINNSIRGLKNSFKKEEEQISYVKFEQISKAIYSEKMALEQTKHLIVDSLDQLKDLKIELENEFYGKVSFEEYDVMREKLVALEQTLLAKQREMQRMQDELEKTNEKNKVKMKRLEERYGK